MSIAAEFRAWRRSIVGGPLSDPGASEQIDPRKVEDALWAAFKASAGHRGSVDGAWEDARRFAVDAEEPIVTTPGRPSTARRTMHSLELTEYWDGATAAEAADDMPALAANLTMLIFRLIMMSLEYGIDCPSIWRLARSYVRTLKVEGEYPRDEDGRIIWPPEIKQAFMSDVTDVIGGV